MSIVYVAWLDPAMGKVLGAYATQTEAEAAIGRAQMDGSLSYDGAPTPEILEFEIETPGKPVAETVPRARYDELQGMFDMLERELRTAQEKANEAASDRDRLAELGDDDLRAERDKWLRSSNDMVVEARAERDSLRKLRDNVQRLARGWRDYGVSERPSWAMAADALELVLKGEQ